MGTMNRPYLITYPRIPGIYGTTRILNYPIPKRGDIFWYHLQSDDTIVDQDYHQPREQCIWIFTGIHSSDNLGNGCLRFVNPATTNRSGRVQRISLDLWEEFGRHILQPKKRLPYNVRCIIREIPWDIQAVRELYRIAIPVNEDCKRRIVEFLTCEYARKRAERAPSKDGLIHNIT